jgi:hypothetical protein
MSFFFNNCCIVRFDRCYTSTSALMIFLARYGPAMAVSRGYILAANLDHHRMEIFQKAFGEGSPMPGWRRS